MFCPKCGAQLSDGARFCGACGAAIPAAAPAVTVPAPAASRPSTSERLSACDKESKPLFFMGLILPPAAAAALLALRGSSPLRARSAASGGMVGCVLWALGIAAAYAVYLVQALGYYNSFM